MPPGPTQTASPFIDAGQTYQSIGRTLAGIPLGQDGWGRWWLALAVSLALVGLLVVSLGFLFLDGVAVWGNNIPVTWALDIVSYDWWIGIACGGLLVSGMFLLLGVEWRGALNRISETMALLAAAAAAVYPIIHLGRPWFFYWNLPYPNTYALWPQFRSPLYWDAIDILSFLGLAAGFWFVGLIPDLATLRDRASARALAHGEGRGLLRAQLYGIAALGWRGSAVHWHRWTRAYRTLALLGVLVVVTLQIGASVMFAGTVEPGWHDTLLPVTYLAGALFAGVGLLSVLTVILRDAFGLAALITERHLRVLAWMLLALGLVNIYCEATGDFVTLLGDDKYELANLARRATGPVAWSFWMLMIAGLLPPLLLLIPALRGRPGVLAWIGGMAAAGIWGDHYTLIVATLQHDFLPSAAQTTRITFFEWATFAGSAGLFLFLLLIFLRVLPVISMLGARSLALRTGANQLGAMSSPYHGAPIWGVAAEFEDAGQIERAISSLRKQGDWRVDAYGPLPSRAVSQALGLPPHGLTGFALAGGVAGAAAMFGMCTYATVSDYVFNIGGRPRFSWPAFLVPTASFGCLCAGMAAVAAMCVLNRLPRLNHPAFNIPGFRRATEDRFFVVAHGHGEDFDADMAEEAFRALPDAALTVSRVPR